MPKEKEFTNHPCHLLSLPSAKRFWCRHCMTVFEDAITRWRHSRSCRYGVVNNFMRRRELEAKALQNTTALNPVEARLEQSIQMCDLATPGVLSEPEPGPSQIMGPNPDAFTCFICHKKFASMEEMRIHVKYPCNSTKIITTRVPHPKHGVPVFIDALPGRTQQWQSLQPQQQVETHASTYMQAAAQQQQQQPPTHTGYSVEIQSQPDMETHYDNSTASYGSSSNHTSDSITPTNIYVNEQGETVIEVENLDLNTEGGELSLAHLLTQLSQQGIVFDKTRSAQLQARQEATITGPSGSTITAAEATYQSSTSIPRAEEEEEQPTAEDAANTLAQLAGFRGFTRSSQKTVEVAPDGHPQFTQMNTSTSTVTSTIPGHNNQYTIQNQPQLDIKYEYEYSNPVTSSGPSLVTAQQLALQQAIVAAASQEYEGVKVEQQVPDETLQFYNDPTTVTYVSDTEGHHHMQLGADTSSTMDIKPDMPVQGQPQSIMIQHYPGEVETSSQQLTESCLAEVRNDEPKVVNGELISSSHIAETVARSEEAVLLPDTTGVMAVKEDNDLDPSSDTTNQHGLVTDDPAGSNAHALTIENNHRTDDSVENEGEADDFTIQTVSLQEIVDSEFAGQPSVSSTPHVISQADPASSGLSIVSVTGSAPMDDQNPADSDGTQVKSLLACEGMDMNQLEDTTSHTATTMYVVTSSGILPVTGKQT